MSALSKKSCILCEAAAQVTSPPGPNGAPWATALTACFGCGQWEISHQDLPELKKQTPETKRRIAEMSREHSRKGAGRPFRVEVGVIRKASRMH